MVCLLLVALFTYPGCLWSGSSGSPSDSDSPGYLSPDHPHPRSATHTYIHTYICSRNKFATPIDEKALKPLLAKGTYNHHNITISLIWCAYFSLLYSLTPGVSGQVALAAPVALIALVIYHLTIHTRDLPHSSPLESSARFYTETVPPKLASWHRRHL